MNPIKNIKAIEILDSRGNPTVQTKITLKNGVSAKASVPSGASTGEHEAHELRDQDQERYNGLGVLKAVDNVNKIMAKKLKNQDVSKQKEIDKRLIELDNTKNKSKLGANAILSVSLACARAGAKVKGQPLYKYIRETYNFKKKKRFPIPMMNIFNGGKHADTNLDFQEFMIVPVLEKNIDDKIRVGAEIFHVLGQILREKGYDTDVGNEGGYAPDIDHTIDALDMIMTAIKRAGYEPGRDVFLATDVGASILYDQKKKEYIFKLDNSSLSSDQLIELYSTWLKKYPFISIEDGLDEDDFSGWQKMNHELGDKVMLVGDDLFVTNIKRLEKGIKEKLANAILIKPNQIGTLSETIDCINLAQKNKFKINVSHRSGETNDDFISDLAFACGADFIKAGAPSRGERLAKYNRLLEIYEQEK
ncbi:MAG: phosphopyruvate hydratase [Patescibacteria group bacterium]|nr:phosphopyruvate hydratase [Patescibacteria group bacterium]